MVKFVHPDVLSEEELSLAHDILDNPRTLEAADKALRERVKALSDEANQYARRALEDDKYKAHALRTEGRLLEARHLLEIVTRWIE